jgi:hypothetical protein
VIYFSLPSSGQGPTVVQSGCFHAVFQAVVVECVVLVATSSCQYNSVLKSH